MISACLVASWNSKKWSECAMCLHSRNHPLGSWIHVQSDAKSQVLHGCPLTLIGPFWDLVVLVFVATLGYSGICHVHRKKRLIGISLSWILELWLKLSTVAQAFSGNRSLCEKVPMLLGMKESREVWVGLEDSRP